jgi:hypothetical protein
MDQILPVDLLEPGSASAHKKLIHDILLSLNPYGRFWKNQTGVATSTNGNTIRFGLVGSPDIIGILKNGKFCGIEVKTGKATQSKDQIRFEKMCQSMTAVYILARSVEDTLRELQKIHSEPS